MGDQKAGGPFGKVAELGMYQLLRWGKRELTASLLCAGCFTFMIAFKLHNRLQGGYWSPILQMKNPEGERLSKLSAAAWQPGQRECLRTSAGLLLEGVFIRP